MRRALPLALMLEIVICFTTLPIRAADADVLSSLASFLFLETPVDSSSPPTAASPLASYLYYDQVTASQDSPDLASPLVSYLYYDLVTTSQDSPDLASPLVSYLYCDWPGNENLVFQTSLPVGYFFQGGGMGGPAAFEGRVSNAQGLPVDQALVEIRVMNSVAASATASVDGWYAMPLLPAGAYVLSASKAGWVSDRRVVALNPGTARQDFELRPLLSPPSMTVANSAPAFVLPPDGPQGSALRVFDGAAFVANFGLLDRSKMTVVLTHGWIPAGENGSPPIVGGWPVTLAGALNAQGVRSVANIVAWDWQSAAKSALPPEEATPQQGIALGEALRAVLGGDYRQKAHFIGHSLGALVNGYAVDYVHGHQRAGHRVAAQPWLAANTHVTMCDDAAIARVIAKETLSQLLAGGGKAYASSVVLGWKNPVPESFRWLDNYISSVGRYHPEAVNIVLQKGMLLAIAGQSWFDAAVAAHPYGVASWYPRTVTSPSPIVPGFGSSFEYAAMHPGAEFPPTGFEFVPGIAFRQSERSGDELALELVTDLEFRLYCPAASVVGAAGVESMSDWVETKLDQAASAGRRVGNALVEAGQDVAVGVDDAVDWVARGTGSAWDGVVDLVNRPVIRLQMQTGLPTDFEGFHAAKSTGGATNTPAALWLPVAFPADASMLAIDFVVTGDGRDDAVVFGVDDTKLFTLATRFIPAGVANTSRFLDVSAWAGRTNDLFFGVLGGTSTNCTLRVEGVRFFALSRPALAIAADARGTTALSWPSSANGFVLETTSDLGGGVWKSVTNTPALFGGRFAVTNRWPDPTTFFRLRRL